MKSSGEDKELTSYMDQMDEELARTSIGESFEKVSGICPPPPTPFPHPRAFMRLSDGTSEKRESWDKGDARELETFCVRALRSFPSSPSRASRLSRKREVIPLLSFIINSNFPTKWSRAIGDEAGVGYLFRPRRHQMGYPDIFDNEWKVFRPHYLSRVLFFPNACMVVSARAS